MRTPKASATPEREPSGVSASPSSMATSSSSRTCMRAAASVTVSPWRSRSRRSRSPSTARIRTYGSGCRNSRGWGLRAWTGTRKKPWSRARHSRKRRRNQLHRRSSGGVRAFRRRCRGSSAALLERRTTTLAACTRRWLFEQRLDRLPKGLGQPIHGLERQVHRPRFKAAQVLRRHSQAFGEVLLGQVQGLAEFCDAPADILHEPGVGPMFHGRDAAIGMVPNKACDQLLLSNVLPILDDAGLSDSRRTCA